MIALETDYLVRRKGRNDSDNIVKVHWTTPSGGELENKPQSYL